MNPGPAPIFLGGAYRSGLTLVRAMLDSHSEIACPPDLAIVPALALQWEQVEKVLGDNLARHYATDRDALRAAFTGPITNIFACAARKYDRRLIADKTPANVFVFPQIRKLFPASPLVHVVRDGRDVAASLLTQGWCDPCTGRLLPMCAAAPGAARHWKSAIKQARIAEMLDGPFFQVRYEQLVTDPRAALMPLLSWLGVTFESRMLQFYAHARAYIDLERSSIPLLQKPLVCTQVGRWRHDLTTEQTQEIQFECGMELSDLGYV